MNVVIIEDEMLVAKDLIKLLSKVDQELKVVAVLESVEASKNYFAHKDLPDLIFSDIQLADGVSFDIFKDTTIHCPIIFTTAYDEFAVAAFKLNSIDYLLKPVDEDDLKKALVKFKKVQGNQGKDLTLQFQQMLEQLKGEKKKFKTRFTGHLGKAIIAVQEDLVSYFTKDALIFLVTHDNKQIVTDYQSLEELEEMLNPEKFFRANRQYIININAIDNIKTHFTGKLNVTLKEPLKAEVTVSREKAAEFKKWFEGS